MASQEIKRISILTTAIIVFISILAVGFTYFPRLIGLKTYSIEAGSMAPTIKQGSLVYVRPYDDFNDYNIGDVVTFTNVEKTKNFTHRIVDINMISKSFVTKGDANSENDLEPTPAQYAVGKVEFVIPLVGYAVTFFHSTVAKIAVAVIFVAWLAIELEVFFAERKRKHSE